MQSYLPVTIENGQIKLGDYYLKNEPQIIVKNYDYDYHQIDNESYIFAHSDNKNLEITVYHGMKNGSPKEVLSYNPHFPDDIKAIGELLGAKAKSARDISARLKEAAPETYATWKSRYREMLQGLPVMHRGFIEVKSGQAPTRPNDMVPGLTAPKLEKLKRSRRAVGPAAG